MSCGFGYEILELVGYVEWCRGIEEPRFSRN